MNLAGAYKAVAKSAPMQLEMRLKLLRLTPGPAMARWVKMQGSQPLLIDLTQAHLNDSTKHRIDIH